MKLAPVILFVYNRPLHTKKTVNALLKNSLAKNSELFIFSDGPKKESAVEGVKKVRSCIKTIKGFKKVNIIEREKNFGLANSIITGVTEVINKYGRAIILEDDLITAKNFLSYMNQALEFYLEDKRIFSIAGYNYPIEIPEEYFYDVYLTYRCCSWGWATWKDRWVKADWEVKDYHNFLKCECAQKKFDRGGDDLTDMLKLQMKGKIDSWAIRWCYAHYKNNAFSLQPVRSKVFNIGFDGTGTHHVLGFDKAVLDSGKDKFLFKKDIQIDPDIISNFSKHFKNNWKIKAIKIIKYIFKRNIFFLNKTVYNYIYSGR